MFLSAKIRAFPDVRELRIDNSSSPRNPMFPYLPIL